MRNRPNNFTRFLLGLQICLLVCLLVAEPGILRASPSVVVKDAHLEKFRPEDVGTVHAYIENAGARAVVLKAIVIDKQRINLLSVRGAVLSSMEKSLIFDSDEKGTRSDADRDLISFCYSDDGILWARASPNPVPPGEICELLIRLTRPTRGLIHVLFEGMGERALVTPEYRKQQLRISAIRFAPDFRYAYVYVRNLTPSIVVIKHVYSGMSSVTETCKFSARAIRPNTGSCITVPISRRLEKGSFVSIGVIAKNGQKAYAVVRVHSIFPIVADKQIENTDKGPLMVSERQLGLRTPIRSSIVSIISAPQYPDAGARNGLTKLPTLPEGFFHRFTRDKLSGTGYNAYPAMDVRALKAMAYVGNNGYFRCLAEHGQKLTGMHIGQYRKVAACEMFGELTDVLLHNVGASPVPLASYEDLEGNLSKAAQLLTQLAVRCSGVKCVIALVECGQTPNNTGLRLLQFNQNRPAVPGEVRVQVYSALAEGAQGFVFRQAARSKPVKDEVSRIVSELNFLRPYLLIGAPLPLATTDHDTIQARTILCGDKGIIIILLNQTVHSSLVPEPEPFTYVAETDVRIKVQLPQGWMIEEVICPNGNRRDTLDFQHSGGVLTTTVKQIEVCTPVLVRCRPGE